MRTLIRPAVCLLILAASTLAHGAEVQRRSPSSQVFVDKTLALRIDTT